MLGFPKIARIQKVLRASVLLVVYGVRINELDLSTTWIGVMYNKKLDLIGLQYIRNYLIV